MSDYRTSIVTGDFVGSAWNASPTWTPYAEAIASNYTIQVPWYWSTFESLSRASGAPPPRFTNTMRPFLYDVLIVGASITAVNPAQTITFLDNIYLNITHRETGLRWATANEIGYFHILSLCGSDGFFGGFPVGRPMPIMRLPEAFFLPKGTQLQFDWTLYAPPLQAPVIDFIFTLIGIHLTGGSAPDFITLPGDAGSIRVGSRVPWFSTIPIGDLTSSNQSSFVLQPGAEVTRFWPPEDCNIEIHGAYINLLPNNSTLITMKLTDMGEQKFWTPSRSPAPSFIGYETMVDPAFPLTKPYLLKHGHRLRLVSLNNTTAPLAPASTVTLTGVRRCQF